MMPAAVRPSKPAADRRNDGTRGPVDLTIAASGLWRRVAGVTSDIGTFRTGIVRLRSTVSWSAATVACARSDGSSNPRSEEIHDLLNQVRQVRGRMRQRSRRLTGGSGLEQSTIYVAECSRSAQ